MTDFQTWLLDYGYDRLFRIWIHHPGENYWEEECDYVFIKEAIELPDGDILLGFHFILDADDLDDENPHIEYWKLSQLQLAYYPDDIKRENWS